MDPNEDYVIISNLIDHNPVEALSLLASATSRCSIPNFPQHNNVRSVLVIVEFLARVFDQFRCSLTVEDSPSAFPDQALSALRETFSVLYSIRSLLESCSSGSKIAALLLSDAVAVDFRDVVEELSEVLAAFPWEFFDSPELKDLMDLVRRRCAEKTVQVDKTDLELRAEVVIEIEEIDRDPFPDCRKVRKLFERLDIPDLNQQVSEIMVLDSEMKARLDVRAKTKGLMNFVTYCKMAFFGDLWPEGSSLFCRDPATDWVFPPEVRCPITGAVMRDPVTLISTGKTYDRANIERWILAGNRVCPVTLKPIDGGGAAAATLLAPNEKFHGLVQRWADEQDVELRPLERVTPKMVASYLIGKLSSSPSVEATAQILATVVARAKSNPKLSVRLGDAGIIPRLLQTLVSEDNEENQRAMKTSAMGALEALSRVDQNRERIMGAEHGSGVNTIIDILNEGPTWELRGHAAGALYNLATVTAHKWCLGRETRVMKGLARAARQGAPAWVRGKALAGVLELGSYKAKVEELGLLLKECRRGEVEQVARVLAVEPVFRLLREEKARCGAWEKRGLRRKVGLLMEICFRWLWNWEAWTRSGIFDQEL